MNEEEDKNTSFLEEQNSNSNKDSVIDIDTQHTQHLYKRAKRGYDQISSDNTQGNNNNSELVEIVSKFTVQVCEMNKLLTELVQQNKTLIEQNLIETSCPNPQVTTEIPKVVI